jgi:hypothetical protein
MVLAKRTSKNQLTLPKAIVEASGPADYYDVTMDDGRIVLTPLRTGAADEVRSRLEAMGIGESDVVDAVAWARSK